MHQHAFQSSLGHALNANQAPPGVEKYNLECLERIGPVFLAQKIGDLLGFVQKR